MIVGQTYGHLFMCTKYLQQLTKSDEFFKQFNEYAKKCKIISCIIFTWHGKIYLFGYRLIKGG